MRNENRIIVSNALKVVSFFSRAYYGIRHLEISRFFRYLRDAARISPIKKHDLRSYARSLQKMESYGEGSPLFRKGFSLEPLRDSKYFILNQDHLEKLRKIYKDWLRDNVSATSVIVGNPGSGKSSLLNVLQSEVEIDNVIRMDNSSGFSRGSLIRKLSAELDCDASIPSIRQELRRKKWVIIIDNFEHWFKPQVSGVNSIKKILDLINQTRSSTLWIVSTSHQFYSSFSDHLGILETFNETIELKAHDHRELKELVYNRLSYCGMKIVQKEKHRFKWVRFFNLNDSEELFFRLLARVSRGNIYGAILLWLKAVEMVNDRSVTISVGPLLDSRIDLINLLPAQHLPLIALLDRFGPLSETEIFEAINGDKELLRRQLNYLESNLQIERIGRRKNTFEIKRPIHLIITSALEGA